LPVNQQQMLEQVRKMQERMRKAQEELAATRVVGSASGNAVQIELGADYRVYSVKIAKEAIDPDDAETLEDLVTVAINDGLGKVAAVSQEKLGAVTGGMKLPGLV
jgi:DNA-binding YbaB/EbfC family protein